jgi:hypothetical protein
MGDFQFIKFQPKRPLLRELSADRLNTILQEIRRNKPKGERGITVRQSGDATYIGLASPLAAGAGGAASRRLPWDIYVSGSEGEGDEIQYTLKVEPGTLARILPTNYNDEFTAEKDTLYYGIARVETDGTYINGLTIDITDEEPADNEAQAFGLPANVDILFGLWINGVASNLAGGKDIDVYAKNVITLDRDPPPEPGEPMFDLYFRLQ